ncbi:MAG TPA: ubiquitin-like domain-containing protein, partial [Candidatus Baltobacteraceae bacterium]
MIGRSPIKVGHLAAFSVLAAGLMALGFTTSPSAARADIPASAAVSHVVSFDSNGSTAEHVTTAQTVGSFLQERGIVPGPDDYVAPDPQTPLSDKLAVDYRAAVAVDLISRGRTLHVVSSAPSVAALLTQEHVALIAGDRVYPSPAAALSPNQTIRIVHVARWTRARVQPIPATTVHRVVYSLPYGKTKVLSHGRTGLRQTTVRFTQIDGGKIQKRVLDSHVTRRPRPRIVAEGVDEYDAFMHNRTNALDKTSYVARGEMQMEATAYTAACSG